jgi:hypothetical protein
MIVVCHDGGSGHKPSQRYFPGRAPLLSRRCSTHDSHAPRRLKLTLSVCHTLWPQPRHRTRSACEPFQSCPLKPRGFLCSYSSEAGGQGPVQRGCAPQPRVLDHRLRLRRGIISTSSKTARGVLEATARNLTRRRTILRVPTIYPEHNWPRRYQAGDRHWLVLCLEIDKILPWLPKLGHAVC